MRRALLIGAMAAAALAGVSAAQVPRPGSPEAAGFTQLFISPCGEPYRGRPNDPYPIVLWFKQADLNHDGVITREEFRADHAGFFDALDADGNGVLDGAEVAFYENKVVPDVLGPLREGALSAPASLILAQYDPRPPDQAGGVASGAQGPVGGLGAQRREKVRLEGAAAYGLLREPEPVTAADVNFDGRITKAEFLAAADRRFKALDKKGDGKLTLDELPMTVSQAEAAHRR